MYQRCPICKGRGILKQESCPTCLGERIINKKSGLPPSKYVIPFTYIPTQPYVPFNPYSPCYPLTSPNIYTGGTAQQQILFTNLTN